MVYSRDLYDLKPDVCQQAILWIALCNDEGLDVYIVNTLRDDEKQYQLYLSGYSKSKRTTFHGAGLAIDFCSKSKGYNDLSFFEKAAAIAKKLGFTWGGDWKSFPDKPHLQWDMNGAYTSAMCLAKKAIAKMIYGGNTMYNEELFKKLSQDIYDKNNPLYKTIDDVPEYWRERVKKLMSIGAINGGTDAATNPNDVNIRHDALQAIMVNMISGELSK